MMPHEKTQLLALLDTERSWCQGCEAQDPCGDPVRYDDENAVAWDIVGGTCRLFGWRRACELFGQLHRHISGRRKSLYSENEDIAAMVALFDFNDAINTTYEKVVAALQSMPVWRGRPALAGRDAMCET